ncbi:cyclophane-forming radical SAM/SPASM peptide maturase YhhB [Prosthecodimorpha staleyi]|uniref:cyclophane-forming radical SAM/SPASM peptide maturase YhhB n=1 Tax=Prosthecodimorpha staleyi TaxID=2840188 RepID=UPI0021C36387|nr:cyclophane-forming radical SAM/SPASM peptide maturase YhhB [Prosthecodimorpha staleyi]
MSEYFVLSRITSFLVKIASRCNLDCNYCYVYHHADQGWRVMPKTMTAEVRSAFASRLSAYAKEAALKRALVVFHGGEPLLAGVNAIVDFADELRAAVGPTVKLDLAMQTNGLLLTDTTLDALEAADISVSLSLDGPRVANDLHRTSRKGRSSFDRVMSAYHLLQRRKSIFAGVIAVIDPSIAPDQLLVFFDQLKPPKLDFLLPDAHHRRPPPGREQNPSQYKEWLIRAFDLWFDRYSHLPVRTFEALLDGVAGLPSGTDAFGFGDVNLLSIETDGSYHDLDVLKIVRDGATALSGTVFESAILTVAASPGLEAHRALLRKDGLSDKCLSCTVVEVCGGGSVPHRYDGDGFKNPSVYCDELFSLISHVKARLADSVVAGPEDLSSRLPADFDLTRFELAETSAPAMQMLIDDARSTYLTAFRSALEHASRLRGLAAAAVRIVERGEEVLARLAIEPGVIAWTKAMLADAAGSVVHDVDGKPLHADAEYLTALASRPESVGVALAVAENDPWLRAPFGGQIEFEPQILAATATPLVHEALEIVRGWRPALADELMGACRAVQFVRDPSADPAKIVSFSDDSVPGALFVSVSQGNRLIDAYDLADSLIHEHRHQKLYLLERFGPTVSPTAPRVVSPWRADLRPPSGLLHAVFVFVELRRFWTHVLEAGPPHMRKRAFNQIKDTDRNLGLGFATLRTCSMTPLGEALIRALDVATRQEFGAA